MVDNTPAPVEAGKNETFDSQGRLEVPDETFFSEDELAPAKPEPTKTEAEPTPEPEKPEPVVERAKPGDNDYDPRLPAEAQPIKAKTEPEKPVEPAKPVEPEKPALPAPTPKLYAGKYQTPEELNVAFIQLGGDPANYGNDPDKVAEAYQVRQSEYTRSRQAISQQEMLQRREAEKVERQQKAKDLVTSELNKVIQKNPKDVGELLVQLQEAMTNIVLNTQPEPQAPIDPEALIAQAIPAITERTQRQAELNELEKDVPRLRTDINFRNSFATYLAGRKQTEPRIVLKQAMKDFLGPNQQIINDEITRQTDANKAKSDAISTTGADNGSPTIPKKSTPEDDIVGGIIDANNARIKKFGY